MFITYICCQLSRQRVDLFFGISQLSPQFPNLNIGVVSNLIYLLQA